jgi:hypothetical protein
MGWDKSIGRTRLVTSLISFSDMEACVPGGDPRSARSLAVMDLMGSTGAGSKESPAPGNELLLLFCTLGPDILGESLLHDVLVGSMVGWLVGWLVGL